MDDQEFHKLLEQLHQEIEQSKNVDAYEKDLLRHLSGDIRELLDRSESLPSQARPSMIQQLEEAVAYMEVTHPTVAATMSRLLAILSNAGV